MSDHDIKVTLDYRVAHTVIQGLKMWITKLESLLDEAVAVENKDIPCRRINGADRRKGDERRAHEPDY